MKIILSRHGNTFESNTPATWVGCNNDLPLVAAGVEQANTLAKALKQSGVAPKAIYCGPLQRTLNYAQIIIQKLQINLKPIIDNRLNELDYGLWSGLTNQQIREKFGTEELENWEKFCQWPVNRHWSNSESFVRTEALAFAADLVKLHKPDDTIIVISSNGKLRYFLNLIPGAFETHVAAMSTKVKTGNICGLTYADNQWELNYWDQAPNQELFSKVT